MISDRIMSGLRAIIADELHELPYLATWEYSVQVVHDDGTIDGAPTAAIPLPTLSRVPMGALAAGGVSEPTLGASFLVDFIRRDGTMVAIFGVDPTVRTATLDATGLVEIGPSSGGVELGPAHGTAIARSGDSVQVFFPPGILNGVLQPPPPAPPIPIVALPCVVLTPAPGVIASGRFEARA